MTTTMKRKLINELAMANCKRLHTGLRSDSDPVRSGCCLMKVEEFAIADCKRVREGVVTKPGLDPVYPDCLMKVEELVTADSDPVHLDCPIKVEELATARPDSNPVHLNHLLKEEEVATVTKPNSDAVQPHCLIKVEELAMANCKKLQENLKTKPSSDLVHPDRIFQCKTCDRTFPSFQALGGHRASHKSPKSSTTEPKQTKYKTHACPICGLEFPIGQALGGHMRKHRADGPVGLGGGLVAAQPVLKRSNSKRVLCLDLGLGPCWFKEDEFKKVAPLIEYEDEDEDLNLRLRPPGPN